jgi:putative transcriptional regulator
MKRNLFDELKEGFNALQDVREKKITLRTHVVEKKPSPEITPEELCSLREKLHLSRGVFARYLRTNERTLENWEQGRSKPNAQAAILIRLVEHYPDTVERLSAI